MYNLWNINTVKAILQKNGFTFKKSLGQNFLINPSVCPEMADNAVADGVEGVIEIGTGVGILTAELCRRAKKVVAIELDERLKPVLEETLADFDNVKVIFDDVLKVDLKRLIETEFKGMKVSICANLPYYITSPIIMMLLESKLPIESIIVMVQKEAADRICAEVGSRESGAVTAAVNFYSEAKILFQVSRSSFVPSPNVDSTVIKLSVLDEPSVKPENEQFFFKFVRAGFAQRRKTLANSVSSTLGVDKQKVFAALEQNGLDQNVRTEKLNLEQLCKISDSLYKLRG